MNFAKDGSDSVKIFWRIEEWFPELSDQTKSSLKIYHDELLKFNRSVNLIGVKTIPMADNVHFADCILAHRIILPEMKSDIIYDFGSGNGFPGLVFAILSPEKNFKLVEVDQRKAEFLKHAAATLKLSNVEVLIRQIEKLPEGSVQCAISRGFAPISRAILMSRKIFAVGGHFFHMKGEEWVSEVAAIPTQLCSFWQPSLLGEYRLPLGEIRYSVVKTDKIAK